LPKHSRVEQIVKMFGIVQSTNDFKEQHLVLDGCSDVIMEIFDKPVGYHARSAIGTSTLPLNMSVEIEAVVQIKPESK
jgi:enamine deaminase RidA (YjgF/YER057c/UK114 family)